MNSVDRLLSKPFTELNPEEQMEIKRLGPDHPEIKLEQAADFAGKEHTYKFTVSWYEKTSWLTASTSRNSLFCFPCLLFGGEMSWTKAGVTDLKHLPEELKKHEECKSHLKSSLEFGLFGPVTTEQQLDESYSLSVVRHNEEVDKNRYILSKLIDCLRFCIEFELPLHDHDHDETEFVISGYFTELVNFFASMDPLMKKYLDTATGFKGPSKAVQNDLLDCMLDVARQYIVEQLSSTAYVAIIAEDTTDLPTEIQSALIYRYIDNNDKVVERFYCFNALSDSTEDTISTAIHKELKLVFPAPHDREKIIAQSYDGASVMCGVQRKVKDLYPNAHYVHCYAHQLNLIIVQAVYKISHARVFFGDLSGFPAFFSCSSKRLEVFENIVLQRLSRMIGTRWNFHVRTVNVIYEHREDLLRCFQTIEMSEEFDSNSVGEALRLARTIEDRKFLFFLFFFNDVMFHVDILYNQLQKRDINTVCVQKATSTFVDSINRVKQSIETIDSKLPIETKFSNSRVKLQTLTQVARKVCDIIVADAKERFAFTKHLMSATLLQSELFASHAKSFPTDAFNDTVQAYPMLNKLKLQNELSLLYETPDFHSANGAVALLRVFIETGLQNTFVETERLLRIVITTPMITSEDDRSLSTLKRIRNFLSSTMAQERLDALAMLSLEKELIDSIPEFSKQTIERFALIKERRATFLYK